MKRTWRNWKLFVAILVGVLVATTLFAASNVGANAQMSAMLTRSLADVSVDMRYQAYSWEATSEEVYSLRQRVEHVSNVLRTEAVLSHYNYSWGPTFSEENRTYAIQTNSTVYDGLTHVVGATTLGTNESYIVVGSTSFSDVTIGSNLSLQLTVTRAGLPDLFLNVSLRVVGKVDLTTQARSQLMLYYYIPYYNPYSNYGENVFIVDLDKTVLPLLDAAAAMPDSLGVNNVQLTINIWVNRVALIDMYDIQGSMQALMALETQIQNALGISYMYEGYVYDELYSALSGFFYTAELSRWTFLSISMPVFFIAIYMGITLNDVSFSLRRREVGLLLTKGFTHNQITSMFVMESVLVGLLASGLGLLLAILIVPFFIGSGVYVPISLTTVGLDTMFLTFAFGVGVAVVSTFGPARRAGRIPTTEALREYTLAGEPVGYRKLLAWACLVLGTYKLVVWTLGINALEVLMNIPFTNPILSMLASFWYVFDMLAGFWAPILFLWGLTMILVKGSSRFQTAAERFIHRVMGDLGGLAAHTIRRRPGRTAAVIFLSALLIGYSMQTIGVLASTQDRDIRYVYEYVGADIRVMVRTPENVTDLLPTIRGIDGVRAAAAQYSFTATAPLSTSIYVRAINGSEWAQAAYFEPEWFLPGVPVDQALQALAANNRSIILERLPARQLSADIGGNLTVRFSDSGSPQPLLVVGLFGPEPKYQSYGYMGAWMAEPTWSYVSVDLLSDLGSEVSPTSYVLVGLEAAASNAAVVEALEALDDVLAVESSVTILEGYNSDVLRNSTVRMMQMGVLFAFILASVGALVVVYLTLRERRVSTALMSARGTTYGQTVMMLLAESLTMLLFAISLGLVTGLIVTYGLAKGGALSFYPMLVTLRFMPAPFLPSILLQVGAVVGLLLLATLVPVLVEARSARYDLSILR
jgi:ABC-type antimicrobial peptide transport system permease subunit